MLWEEQDVESSEPFSDEDVNEVKLEKHPTSAWGLKTFVSEGAD